MWTFRRSIHSAELVLHATIVPCKKCPKNQENRCFCVSKVPLSDSPYEQSTPRGGGADCTLSSAVSVL